MSINTYPYVVLEYVVPDFQIFREKDLGLKESLVDSAYKTSQEVLHSREVSHYTGVVFVGHLDQAIYYCFKSTKCYSLWVKQNEEYTALIVPPGQYFIPTFSHEYYKKDLATLFRLEKRHVIGLVHKEGGSIFYKEIPPIEVPDWWSLVQLNILFPSEPPPTKGWYKFAPTSPPTRLTVFTPASPTKP